jgi:ATP-dependent protease ClpP protease subunit
MTKIDLKGPIVSNNVGWLYHWFGFDAACPNDIAEGLKEAAGDDVVIEINSPGGVCVYGYEMYKAVKEYEGRVTVHVICAMSAATIIACAADETLMSDAAIFMIHNARSSADGDYRDMYMEGQALEEINEGIINVYMKKTKLGRDEIQALMDSDTYMAPRKAIELGFADGYIFGSPDDSEGAGEDDAVDFVGSIVAAKTQIMAEDKAREMIGLIKMSQAGAVDGGEDLNKGQFGGVGTVADISNEGGSKDMTLSEFLTQNPEAKSEIEEIRVNAEKVGRDLERERIKSLDAIAATVKAEALNEAKYGDKPVDGPTLAYQAMVSGEKLAGAYMASALRDSEDSGVMNVGVGTPDAGGEETDEAEDMAAYINQLKGGK